MAKVEFGAETIEAIEVKEIKKSGRPKGSKNKNVYSGKKEFKKVAVNIYLTEKQIQAIDNAGKEVCKTRNEFLRKILADNIKDFKINS